MKAFNGQAKMANGGSEHGIIATVRGGYRKWVLDKLSASTPEERTGNITVTDVLKAIGCVFSIIGVITTLRWMASSTATSDAALKSVHLPPNSPEVAKECLEGNCPWSHVFSDLTNRLHLLEMAFKEQVVARETIEREVNNQTDLNSFLNEKLGDFNEKLDNLTRHYIMMERRISNLASKLRSDEILGLIFFILILLELLSRIQPHVRKWMEARKDLKQKTTITKEEKKVENVKKIVEIIKRNGDVVHKKNGDKKHNSSAHSTPKHAVLRNEMCVLLFRRENNNVYASLMETMLKHFNDVKLASNPFFIVDTINDIKNVPPVKLYVVICDCEVSSGKTNGWDLYIAVIKVLKTLTGEFGKEKPNVVVIIANEEGSKKLVAHTMYNANLRLINSFEIMQDLAANGRLFTMWREMTPHQMSHVRKIVRSVLNVRPSMIPTR